MLKVYYNLWKTTYTDGEYTILEDFKLHFDNYGAPWVVESFDKANNILVVKNTGGYLNYDPYIIITTNSDRNTLYFYSCKSYDSSKAPIDQEGAINKDTNYEDFGVGNGSTFSGLNKGSNMYMIINDYSFYFYRLNYTMSSYNFYYSIVNLSDKDNGGVYINSSFHKAADNTYLFYNNEWYGNTDTGIYGKKFTTDIDKCSNFRHDPSPIGGMSASPITFFIDTNNDTSINSWQYIGKTYDYFTKNIETVTNIIDTNGNIKLYYTISIGRISLSLISSEDNITFYPGS